MPAISKFMDVNKSFWELSDGVLRRDGEMIVYLDDIPALIEELPELAAWMRAEYDKQKPKEYSGWIKWAGGECPVDTKCEVAVRLRNGYTIKSIPAWQCDWEQEDGPNAILEYRIVD